MFGFLAVEFAGGKRRAHPPQSCSPEMPRSMFGLGGASGMKLMDPPNEYIDPTPTPSALADRWFML